MRRYNGSLFIGSYIESKVANKSIREPIGLLCLSINNQLANFDVQVRAGPLDHHLLDHSAAGMRICLVPMPLVTARVLAGPPAHASPCYTLSSQVDAFEYALVFDYDSVGSPVAKGAVSVVNFKYSMQRTMTTKFFSIFIVILMWGFLHFCCLCGAAPCCWWQPAGPQPPPHLLQAEAHPQHLLHHHLRATHSF